jgi:hypothetical protein
MLLDHPADHEEDGPCLLPGQFPEDGASVPSQIVRLVFVRRAVRALEVEADEQTSSVSDRTVSVDDDPPQIVGDALGSPLPLPLPLPPSPAAAGHA